MNLICDPPKPNQPRGLLATRAIEASPLPEDKGRVGYFGGYDPSSIESHNTAWLNKGELPQPKAKELGPRDAPISCNPEPVPLSRKERPNARNV